MTEIRTDKDLNMNDEAWFEIIVYEVILGWTDWFCC